MVFPFMDNDSCDNLSVLQAETLALSMAIKKIKELNLSIVEIEGDNLCLMNVLICTWNCPWNINLLTSDTLFYIRFLQGLCFRHVVDESRC